MTVTPGSRQAHKEASERDKRVRRFLLRLSLANWGIAVIAWTISAFLGIASPASIIVYSVLFVIGLIAVIVALLTYVLEKFAHRPPDYEHADLEADGDESDAPTAVAAEGGTKAAADSTATAPRADLAEGEASVPASDGKDAAAPRGAAAEGEAKAGPKGDSQAAPKGDAPAAPAG